MNLARIHPGGIVTTRMEFDRSRQGLGERDDDEWFDRFQASMPESYKLLHEQHAIRLHARIAQARGADTVHLEWMADASSNAPSLCVVALSSPGLLAAISTALALRGLDVVRADMYVRRTESGDDETLALFCLRWTEENSTGSVDALQPPRLEASVIELLRSQALASRSQEPSYTNHLQRGDAVACFRKVRGTSRHIIELHCKHRPAILAAVTTALSKQGILIVGARARSSGSRVHGYFEIEEPVPSPATYPRWPQLLATLVDAASGKGEGSTCPSVGELQLVSTHDASARHCSASSVTSIDRLSSCER